MNKNGKYYKVCIILSGGVGTRLGASTPKQYIEVNGKSILEYALNAVISWKDMDSLIVVADKNWFEYIRGTLSEKVSSSTGFYYVVDVNGIGYNLEVSETDYNSQIKKNDEVKLYTSESSNS